MPELPQGHRDPHLPAHQLRHPEATDPTSVTMSQFIHKPPKTTVDNRPTDKSEKKFEPPMNTDEHRSKADKEKCLSRLSASLSLDFSRSKAETTDFTDGRRPNAHGPAAGGLRRARRSVGAPRPRPPKGAIPVPPLKPRLTKRHLRLKAFWLRVADNRNVFL